MIYFIETQGLVKIGHSSDPLKRLGAIATGCPTKCHLIGVVFGGMEEERALHKRFSAFRSHGEWFRFDKAINEYISANAVNVDKYSHTRKPPKNAPPRWSEISEIAKAAGAGDWAMRKWLERGEIPAKWKLTIHNSSGGKISLADMEISHSTEGATR